MGGWDDDLSVNTVRTFRSAPGGASERNAGSARIEFVSIPCVAPLALPGALRNVRTVVTILRSLRYVRYAGASGVL